MVTENRGFLTETKAAAAANNVTVIDLNQLSMNLYTSLRFCPNDGDYTSTTLRLGSKPRDSTAATAASSINWLQAPPRFPERSTWRNRKKSLS